MCLITNQRKSEKAVEDIVAFKALYRELDSAAISPHYYFLWKQGKKYKSKLKKNVNYKGTYTVNDGFYAFLNEDDAYTHSKIIECCCAVAKMIIPKGSKYYATNGYLLQKEQIASDHMIFSEFIEYKHK